MIVRDVVQCEQVRSQSTIKMDKGYYWNNFGNYYISRFVAIHNKNGQGLLLVWEKLKPSFTAVAIHNKNGKGLLLKKEANDE